MNNKEYLTVFEEIKAKIRSARRNALLAVNHEIVVWNFLLSKAIQSGI
jgi:hypothetical protein